MNKINHSEILLSRNRTKRRCSVYYYEAMGNLARSLNMTASEFFFGCGALALIKCGKDMGFLKDSDKLILNRIRVCMSYNQ